MPDDQKPTVDPALRTFLLVVREACYVVVRGIERMLGIPGARRGGNG